MSDKDVFDPKGLIRESFRIEGIGAPECRSIFLDWALGVPAGRDTRQEVEKLLAHYSTRYPAEHPMFETLQAALAETPTPTRRGGRRGRML